MMKSSGCFTVIMGICLIYLISMWTSICFELWPNFFNFAYSCFTFGKVDLEPTVEEYIALLRCLKIQVDRAYSRAVNVPNFAKKLMNITGMREQWVTVRIRHKRRKQIYSLEKLARSNFGTP
ncbi:hypothetical protein Goari_019769 [Gossypium aridum]|uniref:Uncharacterized protein n=1 Tax=Gossypium aridum TaxID=34290 RepID=A0A7J8WV31_GOSAI|nr:hypothetical protein [Gossypium aridum]